MLYPEKIQKTEILFALHFNGINHPKFQNFEVIFNISSGGVLKLCRISWSLLVYQNLFSFLVLRKC